MSRIAQENLKGKLAQHYSLCLCPLRTLLPLGRRIYVALHSKDNQRSVSLKCQQRERADKSRYVNCRYNRRAMSRRTGPFE